MRRRVLLVMTMLVAAGCAGKLPRGSWRRVKEWGLLLQTGRDLTLMTEAGTRLWREVGVCGGRALGKIHPARATALIAFTCKEGREEVSLRVAELYPRYRLRMELEAKRTLVGWTSDDAWLLAWDNTLARGNIDALDPSTGEVKASYCCATVALPGPGRNVIGLSAPSDVTQLNLLEPGRIIGLIAVVQGHVSEVDFVPGLSKVVVGIRPRINSRRSYRLEAIRLDTGSVKTLMSRDGHLWLHLATEHGLLVNEVTGCAPGQTSSGQSPVDASKPEACQGRLQVLKPLWISWNGKAQELRTPTVAGFWLRQDGAILVKDFIDGGPTASAVVVYADGSTIPITATEVYEPYWVMLR